MHAKGNHEQFARTDASRKVEDSKSSDLPALTVPLIVCWQSRVSGGAEHSICHQNLHYELLTSSWGYYFESGWTLLVLDRMIIISCKWRRGKKNVRSKFALQASNYLIWMLFWVWLSTAWPLLYDNHLVLVEVQKTASDCLTRMFVRLKMSPYPVNWRVQV